MNKDLFDTAVKQAELLAKWGEENINNDPEQVRRNLGTIISVALCESEPVDYGYAFGSSELNNSK